MVFFWVRKMLSDIIGVEPETITARASLLNGGGVDPIDVAKLVIACEKRFHITVHDEDVLTLRSVGELCAHIDQMLADGLDAHELTDEERTAWYYQ